MLKFFTKRKARRLKKKYPHRFQDVATGKHYGITPFGRAVEFKIKKKKGSIW